MVAFCGASASASGGVFNMGGIIIGGGGGGAMLEVMSVGATIATALADVFFPYYASAASEVFTVRFLMAVVSSVSVVA